MFLNITRWPIKGVVLRVAADAVAVVTIRTLAMAQLAITAADPVAIVHRPKLLCARKLVRHPLLVSTFHPTLPGIGHENRPQPRPPPPIQDPKSPIRIVALTPTLLSNSKHCNMTKN
jgi:hypothetical protein